MATKKTPFGRPPRQVASTASKILRRRLAEKERKPIGGIETAPKATKPQ